ncbi:MAG: ABC transporter ATP-binding protein [Bacillota bacterium]|nr:ABC transporter ATP-binding protein [Bacillota bacterium]
MTISPSLRAVNLTKTYHVNELVWAIRNLYLDIFAGDFVVLAGPSGSGKSTLLHLLAGLDRPIYGDVVLEGQRYSRLDEDGLARLRRSKMGFVYQFFNLISYLSAEDNVALPLQFAGRPLPAARRRAAELLSLVGMDQRRRHLPSQLSGGEQQRVAIARAMANEPDFLLADEPTGNLDSHRAHDIVELFARLNRDMGKTVVVVSHSDLFHRYANRVLGMLDGRLDTEQRRVGGELRPVEHRR